MVDEQVALIREQVGDGRAICGLSGGVDSSVAALIVHRALGDRLTCVLVDHGLLRKDEAEQVVTRLPRPLRRAAGATWTRASASSRGSRASTTPSRSAASSARSSSACSRRRRRSSTTSSFLVQGTLYSDVIESGGGASGGAAKIKSHHNVGGLPERFDFDLIEPLRQLFKDEVRAVGRGAGPAGAARLAPAVPGPGPGDPRSSAAR